MAASPAWLKMPLTHRQGSPSAKTVTWAAWAALEIPIPTQTGSWVVALMRFTSELEVRLAYPAEAWQARPSDRQMRGSPKECMPGVPLG
jgi:hypothetical protein